MKKVKIEWCENFIRKTFEKKQCKGIEVGCFWDMAEKSGLWKRGTCGTPMSEALERLTTVEVATDVSGNFAYHVFRLV
ncbi:MAG: hypothetical protein HFH72_08650 [Lachnospiraceae bacterium]|nr:hypothetical protein [Lachnospiraceae bacterium]